jgi:hypothetical protein
MSDLAALVAALLVSHGGGADPARTAYLGRVSSVCLTYARRLERVPAPSDPTAYGDVIASLRRVVPLLQAQERAMRTVPPPSGLRKAPESLFALDRSSVVPLQAALSAARRRDAGGVAKGLLRFSALRDRVHQAALALGVRCEPN